MMQRKLSKIILKHSVCGESCVTSILVLMTVATKREAEHIIRSLLNKRLIACANVLGPVESQFWWQKRIEKAKEFLVFMKSDEKLFERLAKKVKEMHSYETPEILALPIVRGWTPYMEWLNATLQTS